MRPAIVVFAKEPRPGHVKTRMCPPLSPDEAAQLYARLLDDVLDATARFARNLGLDALLTVHPPEACGALAARAPARFRVVAQRGRNLAERMEWALAETAAGGHAPVLLRGSDSPALDEAGVAGALAALGEADLALCPDRDGGYSLVGARRPVRGLFDHPMSTGSVLEDTLANAERLGLRARVLPASFDLDTADDLAHLASARARMDTWLCRRTLAWLDDHRAWDRTGARAGNRDP